MGLPLIQYCWIALFFIATGALGWLLWFDRGDTPNTSPTALVLPGAGMVAASGHTPAPLGAVAKPAEPDSLPLPHASLRDTAPDGDWGIDARGIFRPGLALRQRFDYYLSLQGELPLADITRTVEQVLRRSHADPAAAQVMALWSRYLQLQQHEWQVVADPRNPATLSAALAERVPVRRQYLGADVADAFYRDEEQDFRERVARMNAGLPEPAPANTAAPLLPDAEARLAALRAEQLAWQRRLETSRLAVARIRQNAALSASQRDAAVNAHLAQNYTPNEQVRAQALLGL